MSTGKNKVIKLAAYVDVKQVFARVMGVFGHSTVQEFADYFGCALQTAYNYQRGDRDLPWPVIFEALEKSGKGLDWLIRGECIENKVVPIPIGRNSRDVVEWVEGKGELAKEYDGMVRIAVGEKWPEFLEWQKKREQLGECGTPANIESEVNGK